VSYYNEHEDAKETQRLVESAGRTCMLMAGDIKDPQHCRTIIDKAVATFGQIDVLVNNAAHQASFSSPEDISDEEWDATFRTNVQAKASRLGLPLCSASAPPAHRGIVITDPAPLWRIIAGAE
jgi:NAD(P)-dependent dehydrogenase (short-subunit alcohol dehydrogenase family)